MDSMLQALGPYELTPLGSSLKFLRIASGEINGKESVLNPEFIACGDPRHDWAKLLSQ